MVLEAEADVQELMPRKVVSGKARNGTGFGHV